jgi:hypothetical protein
MEFDVVCSVFM